MTITNKTKYSDFEQYEPYIGADDVCRLKELAQENYGKYMTLTIAEFFGLTGGNYELLGDIQDPSVLQVYWLRGFADFVKDFTNTCTRLTIPQTPEEEQAESGCVKLQPQEAVLLFLQDFYGLHYMREAEQMTIFDYILARKGAYNRRLTQRNWENIQRQKLKAK